MVFHEEKDLAMCGLACVLCSVEDCPGCKKRGCAQGCDCTLYSCATKKELDGCYQCDEFPCEEKMLQGVRNRAFNRYARQFGKEALLERLKGNAEHGIVYHQPDGLKGDYDLLETEDEIMQLIQFGRNNPYDECPSFETEHFIIRLIQEEDAEDLFVCYGDPQAQRFFNNENCRPFEFTLEKMPELIHWWLETEYMGRNYIRFSIVDKQNMKAVGTMETYDRKYHQSQRTTVILRVDIAAAYEKAEYLSEVIKVGNDVFFDIYHVKRILTKAIPEAEDRRKALTESGYQPVEVEGKEHYFMLEAS